MKHDNTIPPQSPDNGIISISQLLQAVDDDIAAVLAGIVGEPSESTAIPLLEDVVDSTSSVPRSDEFSQYAPVSPPEAANEAHYHGRRPAPAAAAHERAYPARDFAVNITIDEHSAIAFSGDDFDSLPPPDIEAAATESAANDAIPPATPPVDTDAIAELATVVVGDVLDEWLPILREECSRRLQQALASDR